MSSPHRLLFDNSTSHIKNVWPIWALSIWQRNDRIWSEKKSFFFQTEVSRKVEWNRRIEKKNPGATAVQIFVNKFTKQII